MVAMDRRRQEEVEGAKNVARRRRTREGVWCLMEDGGLDGR